jgi:hypothetical protein
VIAALTLFLVLTLSIVVVRTGAVALRLTGMPEEAARFQARSAFTGAGFTTSESEAIVNHPVRRRIVSTLMVVGSIGLVSVMTTIVVSLVGSDDAEGGMLQQLVWLVGVLLILWCVALNPKADRVMCGAIGRILERSQGFGARVPVRLLQMPAEHGVTRILVHPESGLAGRTLNELTSNNVMVLGLEREDGTFLSRPDLAEEMRLADEVFVYGPDDAVSALQETVRNRQRAKS